MNVTWVVPSDRLNMPQVPLTPVGPVIVPPGAMRSGGHAVAHAPEQVLELFGSDDRVYRVFPVGPVKNVPSDPLDVPSVTLEGAAARTEVAPSVTAIAPTTSATRNLRGACLGK